MNKSFTDCVDKVTNGKIDGHITFQRLTVTALHYYVNFVELSNKQSYTVIFNDNLRKHPCNTANQFILPNLYKCLLAKLKMFLFDCKSILEFGLHEDSCDPLVNIQL